ncbi:MAG: hypothetical protein A2010_10105 [Nitrospirae bacterium GWD2_57_9]|nr:MAG: hypothetical protein A2010_10105 [Nitrospirae bacterium GWD2_57_9]
MPDIKAAIRQALEADDLDAVASLARKDRKVLSQLVRLAYDKETLAGWRAIKAIGRSAKEMVNKDYAFLRETIRKQLWSLNDESGGIGWSAPEIVGEIVSCAPDRFRDIIPLLAQVYDVDEVVFRPGVLYALATIAEVLPTAVEPYTNLAVKALSDENAMVRVRGLEIIRLLRDLLSDTDRAAVMREMPRLLSDQSEVWIYKNSHFINIQVKEAAEETV